jgi:predicted ATPase
VVPGALVGRQRELDALSSALQAARGGTGRLVLCAGEPGIGKTRLAQELAGRALAAGVPVAWGRCVEGGGAPAFWPWRSVLRSLGADSDDVLTGDVESPTDRFTLFEAVGAALARAAGNGGLVVILDDLHWADEPTLLLLRHLVDELVGRPVLVVATVRSAAVPQALPDVLRAPGAERLELRPLALPEVREQLAALGNDRSGADAATVLDITGGNPLFVREVAGAIADGSWRPDRPPRSVLDVVRGRLDRVSPGCRRLVQAAAVVGHDVPVAVLAGVLDQPVVECLPLLDEAVAADLLRPAGDGHRFVHALTRNAVEASLPSAERVALHRAAADVLEARFAGEAAEIARHWVALAPFGEAAPARRWTARAAEAATQRLAYEEAVRLFRSALQLDPAAPADERAQLLLALGRAARLAGDVEGGLEAATAAAAAARAADRPDLLAEAALVPEAVPDLAVNAVTRDLCDEALPLAPDGALRARLLAQRSHLAF